jgi:hypothetical protein
MNSFQQQVEGIEEPIEGRALVRYVPEDGSDPYWGALLRTREALYVLYGSDPGWFGRLVNKSEPEHRMVTIPNEEIESIELPPARKGVLARLFAPKSERVTIVVGGGETLVLEIDRDAEGELIKTGASVHRPAPN